MSFGGSRKRQNKRDCLRCLANLRQSDNTSHCRYLNSHVGLSWELECTVLWSRVMFSETPGPGDTMRTGRFLLPAHWWLSLLCDSDIFSLGQCPKVWIPRVSPSCIPSPAGTQVAWWWFPTHQLCLSQSHCLPIVFLSRHRFYLLDFLKHKSASRKSNE